ncbi:hypothetical protein DU508_09960 [Pedobacter chinensis]|uniref:Uncharacterized protein n=2 Tax=Pedobacter chinensis TaxID=2282421 RepID=A0A369PY98_9SPHI|nr:hypothetical protein DU508_09960 [Pedobacter chinensis]
MLGLAMVATVTLSGCKKNEPIEKEKDFQTFAGKPNSSANAPSWEAYAKSEIFPYGDGTQWKTAIPWDGQTIYMSNVQLRNGYASGYAVAVITGTPELPTGEVGNLVAGDNPGDGPSRIFGYTRRSCNPPTIYKTTSTWTNYNMIGKDNAGDTFTAYGSQFQQTNEWNIAIDNPDGFDIAERFFDNIHKVKITRVLFYGLGNCQTNPKLVTFKLAALKDSQGVIHFYIAHPNYQESRITSIPLPIDPI